MIVITIIIEVFTISIFIFLSCFFITLPSVV